jgi:hypothetical protein
MSEMMDEALQRLYWACRHGKEFPGETPDESTGSVTTVAILDGLGLTTPNHGDPSSPVIRTQQKLPTKNDDQRGKGQFLMTPPAESALAQNKYSTNPQSSTTKSLSTYGRKISIASSLLHSPTSSESHSNLNIKTHSQHMHESTPQTSTYDPHDRFKLHHAAEAPGPGLNTDSYVEVDALLHTSSCAFSNTFQPADNFGEAMYWEPALQEAQKSYLPEQQAVDGTAWDSYLAPWPGSLAAAYQAAAHQSVAFV